MPKGSQLSQLKSALSNVGITGQSQSNGKKRKRTHSISQDKEKKAAKLEEIHRKLNPFDVKVTKMKHDVGGRKIKGISGRPAQSKQAGIDQRKKTLLKEYEERGRSGGIVDRRFGENDPSMSLEERMLERFTKERQRTSRGAAFNLEDEEELTHYGQSLSNLDNFDNVELGLDEEGEDTQVRKKADVFAEVMAKSKEHKFRRQMEREQDDNVRHQLDEEFDSLRSLIYAPDPSSTGSNSIPLGVSAREDAPGPGPSASTAPLVEDYDTHVRELAFDKRAQPKDRTKTEGELALEEKEALEKAERQRKRRMLGEEDSEEEGKGRGRGKRKRGQGADDLDDDFYEEDWGGLGTGLGADADAAVGREDIESRSSEGEDGNASGSKDESEGDGEGDKSGVDSGDDDSGAEAEPGEQTELTTNTTRKKAASSSSKELPFTFPCPETHQQFLEIVKDVDDTDIPIVIKRIRALYHPSLAPENKLKLQTLTSVIVEHIIYITSYSSPPTDLLSSILPHLFALTKSYPIQSAESFVGKLTLMHKNLKHGLSRGAVDHEAKTWPGPPELSLLRVIGTIWPTSDMNHPVVSPARLLIGAYLGLGRIRSMKDVASGLFLCTLFLKYEELSKRLVPEAINFLVNTTIHLCPHQIQDASSIPGSFPCPDFLSDQCRLLKLRPKKATGLALQKPNLSRILGGDEVDEQSKVNLLGITFDVLGRFSEMNKGLEGFVELYQPISSLLSKLDSSKLPKDLQTRITSLQDAIHRLLKFSFQARRPLALQAHKPIPIPTFIPKFEATSSSYFRHQDPDHERNQASKLRHQYKQERKGAIRELRKDARFLSAVEQKKQMEKDSAYKSSMNKVFSSIERERAEQKAMERERTRDKKRSGRK